MSDTATPPLNIAILGSRGFPSTYGGYETLVRFLARWLVAEGHNVTVYCRTRDEGRHAWTTEDVNCVATRGVDSKSLSTLSFGLTSAADAMRRDFDAVLVLNIANGFFLPMLRARSIPVAVNTDGIEWERGKWGTVAKKMFLAGAAMTARFANALIADSEAIGDIWQERYGVGSAFVPYGAPVLHDVSPDPLKSIDGIEQGQYLLVVARLIPENNVDLALDALEQLGPSAPPAVIVGSANFDSPIEARLRALEATNKVQWLGHVDDQTLLAALWAHCGVYFHGHSVGGTNPALLQALGAGAPVLALDTVFNREVLRADRHLVGPDASLLAQRITDVLASSTEQAEMRAYGQQIVNERYQWDDVCRRYYDVLAGIARPRRARR